MSFGESFRYAYNTTIDSVPILNCLYEKVPVLADEEALRQGLMRFKTVLTMVKNLDPPKCVSFVREIVRASPMLYKVVEKNCPELHKILNPRGGKVPRTYLGKIFAKTATDVEKKLATQIMREVRKALPKLGRALLGLDAEAAKLVLENVVSKSSQIVAKCPEVEWAWIAGWGGLVVGSVAYATMDQLGINQAMQGSVQCVFRWWYGTDVTDASTDRMTVQLLRKKLQILHQGLNDQTSTLGVQPPTLTIAKMKSLVQQLDQAEQKVIDKHEDLVKTENPQKAVERYENNPLGGGRRF